ncbi:hypothetical protein QR680_013831 [Steinernema hermaphroditum]|uniref:Fatty-acid and retinol-binding protein 1 n=1 Tax=Steinernema hermaphroditum TaxID=289476 RepID=A0AA39I946_9BILA|nr:hypothetical protein QR680_013831 [Steinernema hermaphroditum]
MKALFASLALLAALASAQDPANVATGAAGNVAEAAGKVAGAAPSVPIGPNVDVFEKAKEFLPPLIHDAFDKFTPEGKEAMKKIIMEAASAATKGQPMSEQQVMDKLKAASLPDYELVEKAGKELDEAVAKLPKGVQDAYASAKEVFGGGKVIKNAADMLPFAQKLQSLSESEREEFFKLFPQTKKFYNSDAFKKILAGSN